MSTIFNKIINKEITADILYEDDLSIAFRDLNPQAPEHILIIPKKSIKTINDIEESDKSLIGHLFIVAKNIAKDINISESGYRIVFNCNENAGQSVFHIHMHLIGGRKMLWPPG
ncbi:histidine triad nucleotide-binding protein [Candidatus Marinimicrobia bacterium]|jgi:histidine triad (HIT) family protein|nr:histidine triad nucleotide-binding protein [Candidatus Neomarinimicrobiota bacterium]